MDNLNLLVTGGCGFIGSNFCNNFFNIVNKLIIIDKLTYAGNMNNIKNIIDSNNVVASILFILIPCLGLFYIWR